MTAERQEVVSHLDAAVDMKDFAVLLSATDELKFMSEHLADEARALDRHSRDTRRAGR